MAINSTWRLCPWAEALYAADPTWWRSDQAPAAGAFAGRRMTQDVNWKAVAEAEALGLDVWRSLDLPGLSLAAPTIHQGGNSGYQACNVAVLEGASRVLLTGFDMAAAAAGLHWHGAHGAGLHNPEPGQMARWRASFAKALPDFAAAGVEILNCTRGGALDEVPRRPLEEAL